MRLATVLLLFTLAGCDAAAPGAPTPATPAAPTEAASDDGAPDDPRTARPLAYAVKANYDAPGAPERADRRRLELFVPGGFGPHPIVVLIHGGGFTAGSRTEVAALGRTLQSLGYAAAAVGYRLSPSTPAPEDPDRVVHPDHTNDVADAVRWLVSNAADHRLDAGTIVLLGHSSGSTIATLLGTAPGYLAEAGIERERIAGVMRIDGHATDLAELFPRETPYADPQTITIFGPERANLYPEIVDTAPDGEPIYAEPSPLNLSPWYEVRPGAALPPLFVAAGTARDRARYSKAYHLRLRAAGYASEYVYAPLNHGRMLNALRRPDGRVEAEYQARALAFLEAVTGTSARRP